MAIEGGFWVYTDKLHFGNCEFIWEFGIFQKKKKIGFFVFLKKKTFFFLKKKGSYKGLGVFLLPNKTDLSKSKLIGKENNKVFVFQKESIMRNGKKLKKSIEKIKNFIFLS